MSRHREPIIEPNPAEIRESPGSVCVWYISLERERTNILGTDCTTVKLTGWRMERIIIFSLKGFRVHIRIT